MLVVLFYVGIMVEGAKSLILDLDVWFSKQLVLNAMGIIYLQYWLQIDVEVTFPWHLEVLKGIYCNPWPCGTISRGEICSYCSSNSFGVGFGCSTRSFLWWQWNPILFKPWLKWLPLHPTKQTPSLWIHWHACGRWSMHLNSYLIPFQSIWN